MKRLVQYLIIVLWTGAFLCKPEISEALFNARPDSIRLVYNEQQLRLPGESIQIGVMAYYKKGKIRRTTGMLGGSVFWWRYKIEVSWGKYTSGTGKRVIIASEL
jgi:hypothetical protein